MADQPQVPDPETSPNWVAGVRWRLPFYIIIAVLLAIDLFILGMNLLMAGRVLIGAVV